ncbi:prolyl 4-hydroxylase subunit alpha-2-like isoform X1 [Tigriopus californicus]|uniref:prolyl 4-hydroxylase subunit alpha-2-like isoform X1 n=1 Tax=Tigriopus californicus TaxID=6832 RepID=UPI0027DA59F4|nr:prolyl 4-hydroxylase subunit alpha-2-like isoform X1 [Tigriopus californicus]
MVLVLCESAMHLQRDNLKNRFHGKNLWHLLIIIVAIQSSVFGDNADLFSSISDTERLFEIEIQFSRDIVTYVEALENHAKAIRKYVDLAYPEGPLKDVPDKEAFVANPLNSFGMVKRLGPHFLDHDMANLLADQTLMELQTKLSNNSKVFPTASNFEEIVISLSLLQETYQLNSSDLADGFITYDGQKYQSDFRLNPRDMMEIGIGATNSGWWDNGIRWFQIAEQKQRNSTDVVFSKILAQKVREGTIYHDKLLDQRGQFGATHRCFPVPFDKKLKKKKKYKKVKQNVNYIREKILQQKLFHAEIPSQVKKAMSFDMCSNGVREWRTPEHDRRLRCAFIHHQDPYFRLGPFKVEVLNETPFVSMFHNFMHDAEMDHYKDYAKPNLARSVTGLADTQARVQTRTSKQAWLAERWFTFNITEASASTIPQNNDLSPPPLPFEPMKYAVDLDVPGANVARRIKYATGLETERPFSGESFQIANYGLGGQYQIHLDGLGFFDGQINPHREKTQFKHNNAVGDRLATFMAYLTDVEAGGHTVFPLLGVSAKPEKGSAIFWINLHTTGKRDELTIHGGCPVLVGSKWITNKWIYSNDQFQKLTCPLSESEARYPVLQRWLDNGAAFV